MRSRAPLYHRQRRPTEAETHAIPWMALLAPAEHERAAQDLKIADADAGEFVCRAGRPATYWFGVIDGLLKMSSDSA